MAFVTKENRKDDPAELAQAIHTDMNKKVSDYKWLRGGIVFLEEIPRSAAGKILKKNLKEILQNSPYDAWHFPEKDSLCESESVYLVRHNEDDYLVKTQ